MVEVVTRHAIACDTFMLGLVAGVTLQAGLAIRYCDLGAAFGLFNFVTAYALLRLVCTMVKLRFTEPILIDMQRRYSPWQSVTFF
jgi:hypothetical protein